VTDNEGKTTQYEYQNQGGSSRMITKVTDKAGAVTNLAWYFADDAGGAWGAYKIEVTDASGLKSVYDRSVASSVDTVTPKDGAAALAKAVYTPLAGDTSRARYMDSYRDASNYDRSSYEYDGSSDLTKALRPGDVTDGTYAYNMVI